MPCMLSDLEKSRGSHPAADAHRDDDVLDAAPLSFDEGVPDHAGPRHAEGVTDGDGPAVDVEVLHRNAQLVAAVHRLAGESFVELPEADVVHLEPLPLEQERYRKHWTDPHFVGLAARHGQAPIDAER